jgi:proteasome beta subunit
MYDQTTTRTTGIDDNQSTIFEPELGSPPDEAVLTDASETLETGTTTVGLTGNNGVVLATDRRASAGNLVASKNAQKILQVHSQAALTISGAVSAAQSLVRSLRSEVNLYETRRNEAMSIQALATLTGNFLRSGAFIVVQPVLGGVDSEGSHVYSIDPAGSVMEEEYAVSGSGSPFALGVLEQEYDEDMSVDEARTVAVRAVQSAVERDTASGNGLSLATITDDGVEIVEYEEFSKAL